MRLSLFMGAATIALIAPAAAMAQSTGTIDAEAKDVVVTGTRNQAVDGIQTPDTSKSRQVLTQEFIQHQVPGQSIDEIINQIPGVSFQSNDPYGSSGGTLSIRGFDASRISQTVDGIPLNDTGNYAIYSGQQVDPELIEQVNVNLGSADVDSPTASATGSTVNYRTRTPTEDFHARMQGSVGSYDMFRVFGVVDTGNLTKWGTRAWLAASHQDYRNPYNQDARINRKQFNGKLYQPLGSGGDFIAVAGTWNEAVANNFSSGVLRTDPTVITVTGAAGNQTIVTTPRVVGTATTNGFPTTTAARDYVVARCQTDTPQTGVADVPNTCGTAYDYSFNPNHTGNIRANSRFTLAPGLVLTIDPSYQYTSANGGSNAVKGNEGFYSRAATPATATAAAIPAIAPIYGYIGGQPYFGGRDLNFDGDVIDTPGRSAAGALTNTTQGVEVYAPSQTVTNRYIVLSSLRYDVTPDQTVRVGYVHDYGRHRQTGQVGYLQPNGFAASVFPYYSPILDASGLAIQKRNRKSFAILDQVFGEYRGRFLDERLAINLGIAGKFFKRNLTNYCVTESGGNGFVDCFNNPASQAAFLAANPTYQPPQSRRFSYSKVLPNGGFTFKLVDRLSLYGNYQKSVQVPGTDNLYNSFSYDIAAQRNTVPETSDNFDVGLRYTSSRIQAQIAGFYTLYKNRLASAYDPEQDITIYRNLGTVDKYGVDGSVAFKPVQPVTLYAFGSYLKSKIRDNVVSGECTAANVNAGASTGTGTCTAVGQPIFALTAGKRESGFPTFTFGGRGQVDYKGFEVGLQAKRTGPRYINDVNLPVVQTYTLNNVVYTYQVYGARTGAYTVVDLDARVSLKSLGLNDRTWLQFNVTNLFDNLYVAGFSGNLSNSSVRNAYISPPRAFSGTLVVGF